MNCSLGPLIKANIKKCDAENEDSLDGDDEKDLAPCHENIVRRSKSVVIHCNSRAPPVHRKTNPVICDTKHDALDDQHDDCLSIKENLDDIKLEIERLIQEREHFFQENSALKFYKGPHLYLEFKLKIMSPNYFVWRPHKDIPVPSITWVVSAEHCGLYYSCDDVREFISDYLSDSNQI